MSTQNRTIKVFVYGTLRPGGRYHHQIAKYVKNEEESLIDGNLFMYPAGWPLCTIGDGVILGTLLTVDLEAIDVMDRIEGCDENTRNKSLFRKELTMTLDGKTCLVYRWCNYGKSDTSEFEPIPEGDYFDFIEKRVSSI